MNERSAPAVRNATTPEWRALGDLLGRAFQDDPVWAWVCPDPVRRRRHLGAAFAQVIRPRVAAEWGWATDGLDGAAVWAGPDAWKTGTVHGLRVAPPLLRAIGLGGLRDRLGALAQLERRHPRVPHWYLEIIGADPSKRGRGIGSALMAPMIERCDAEGLPAYLESSKEENLPFYNRFGFAVTGELVLAPGAPTMWTMWREPR